MASSEVFQFHYIVNQTLQIPPKHDLLMAVIYWNVWLNVISFRTIDRSALKVLLVRFLSISKTIVFHFRRHKGHSCYVQSLRSEQFRMFTVLYLYRGQPGNVQLFFSLWFLLLFLLFCSSIVGVGTLCVDSYVFSTCQTGVGVGGEPIFYLKHETFILKLNLKECNKAV